MSKQYDVLTDTGINSLSAPKFSSHAILWFSLLILLVFFIWAYFAKLDEATVAEGKVIPSSRIQVIQNLEGGIVRRIEVREGQSVQKGQVLMFIDDTQFSSAYQEGTLKAQTLRADIIRLTALIKRQPFIIPEELKQQNPQVVMAAESLYDIELEELETQRANLKEQVSQRQQELQELNAKVLQVARSYKLVKEELDLTQPLVKEGAVSRVELLRLERQANDLKGELESTELSIPRVQSQLEEARGKILALDATFRAEKQAELSAAQSELSVVVQQNNALEDRVTRTSVRSPVNGIVSQIYVNTVGGVVQPGMDLMDIVPSDDTLLVEARVKPADIGFLHPGQTAMVKISAYDFSVYGGLKGTLEHISGDTIEDDQGERFYEIQVRTEKNHLGGEENPMPIIPGMAASVDIITGEKTVLEYMMKPIFKARAEALKER